MDPHYSPSKEISEDASTPWCERRWRAPALTGPSGCWSDPLRSVSRRADPDAVEEHAAAAPGTPRASATNRDIVVKVGRGRPTYDDRFHLPPWRHLHPRRRITLRRARKSSVSPNLPTAHIEEHSGAESAREESGASTEGILQLRHHVSDAESEERSLPQSSDDNSSKNETSVQRSLHIHVHLCARKRCTGGRRGRMLHQHRWIKILLDW